MFALHEGLYLLDPTSEHATIPEGDGTEQNFLDRERAALGDDAALFATPADKICTMEDDREDDLLGGDMGETPATGGASNGIDLDFESSFPELDNRNEVRTPFLVPPSWSPTCQTLTLCARS